MVKLYSILYEKTVENHKIKGGGFLCTGAWPQYAGLQFLRLESGGGVPRSAQEIYKRLCVPDGEVVINIVQNNGRKSL